jgi:uncharacterized membrane protein (UPF0127 family)
MLLTIRRANSWWKRFIGWMFQTVKPEQGLWLTPCQSIHTFFMRSAIDVVYIDRNFRICKLVSHLKPWRFSACFSAKGVLELSPGLIQKMQLKEGQSFPLEGESVSKLSDARKPPTFSKQRGAALIEMTLVAPMLLLLGGTMVQTGLLYHYKLGANYAAQEGARAASVSRGDLSEVRLAMARAMTPWYGGGRNANEIAQSYARALADIGPFSRIEVVNPQPADFAAFNAAHLEQKYGARTIAQSDLWRSWDQGGGAGGNNKLQAMQLRLRISVAAPMSQVPVAGRMMNFLARQWEGLTGQAGAQAAPDAQGSTAEFRRWALLAGRMPMTTEVVIQMQSDLVEPSQYVQGPSGNAGGSGSNVAINDPDARECASALCAGDWSGRPGSPAPDDGTTPGDPGGCQGGSCQVPCATT